MLLIFATRLAQVLNNCDPSSTDPACSVKLPVVEANSDAVKNTLSIFFAILGVVAVILIMLNGLQFITAQGNPERISKARQAIIFAGIGLAIAISGEIIVRVVLGKV